MHDSTHRPPALTRSAKSVGQVPRYRKSLDVRAYCSIAALMSTLLSHVRGLAPHSSGASGLTISSLPSCKASARSDCVRVEPPARGLLRISDSSSVVRQVLRPSDSDRRVRLLGAQAEGLAMSCKTYKFWRSCDAHEPRARGWYVPVHFRVVFINIW